MSYTDAVVMNPALGLSESPAAASAAELGRTHVDTADDVELKQKARDATKYAPPLFRRMQPAGKAVSASNGSPKPRRALTLGSPSRSPSGDAEGDAGRNPPPDRTPTPPPSYADTMDMPTPHWQQDVKHSIIIVRHEAQKEKSDGCPFSGCDGCADPLLCGMRRQYDGSLLLTYLRGQPDGLARADLVAAEHERHALLVAEAQRWDRETEQGKDGMVVHKVLGTDTLQGIAVMYGSTTAAIKRENRMMSADVISYRTLRIPSASAAGQLWTPSPGPRALAAIALHAMVTKLQRAAGMSFEEARVVLDLCDNHIDKALAESKAWDEAEAKLRSHPGNDISGTGIPQPRTLKEFLAKQASR